MLFCSAKSKLGERVQGKWRCSVSKTVGLLLSFFFFFKDPAVCPRGPELELWQSRRSGARLCSVRAPVSRDLMFQESG